MAYKWKPSKSQARAFAQRMNEYPSFATEYIERKEAKAEKRRSTSKFDYPSAGGYYIPTIQQYKFALSIEPINPEEIAAISQIIFGYVSQEKIHHDHIHIINELLRKQSLL